MVLHNRPFTTSLQEIAENSRVQYLAAKPFPHIILDNLFPAELLEEIVDAFPGLDFDWHKFDGAMEKKLASKPNPTLPEKIEGFLSYLNSGNFLRFLERLTSVSGLIPDPHYEGGGLHQILPGGFLKVHADFNKHHEWRLDRRLNLILFLNKDWREEYGGHLQLWDRNLTRCGQKILPVFNRCVIFSTTDFSYHGHPQPLRCPSGVTRKSLALYYYSNGRPQEEVSTEWHDTLFKQVPGDSWLQNQVADQTLSQPPPREEKGSSFASTIDGYLRRFLRKA